MSSVGSHRPEWPRVDLIAHNGEECACREGQRSPTITGSVRMDSGETVRLDGRGVPYAKLEFVPADPAMFAASRAAPLALWPGCLHRWEHFTASITDPETGQTRDIRDRARPKRVHGGNTSKSPDPDAPRQTERGRCNLRDREGVVRGVCSLVRFLVAGWRYGQRMDDLVRILNDMAQVDDGKPTFEITNTSRVIRVTALTRNHFDNPESAFSEARKLADALLATGYVAVNACDIGAEIDLFSDPFVWHGRIKMPVWPKDNLTNDHEIVPGLST